MSSKAMLEPASTSSLFTHLEKEDLIMKKSAFITLSACAIASIALFRIKSSIRRIKTADPFGEWFV